jgi:hypothetical protein
VRQDGETKADAKVQPNGKALVPKYVKLRGKPLDYVAIDENQLSKEDLKSLKFSMQKATQVPIKLEVDSNLLCFLCGGNYDCTRCIVCGASFDKPDKLKNHIRKHSDEELMIDCARCRDRFKFMAKHSYTSTRIQEKENGNDTPVFNGLQNFMPPPMPLRGQDTKIKG